MSKLPAKQLPKTLSLEKRATRFCRMAAICASLCLALCLFSHLIDNHAQAMLAGSEAETGTYSLVDWRQYETTEYLSTSAGVLGCIVGWAVPIIQIGGFGRPLGLHPPKAVVVILVTLAVILVTFVFVQPQLIEGLALSPSILPYPYWEAPVNVPWPFYGAYRVLLRFYDSSNYLEGVLFVAIGLNKLYWSIKDRGSQGELRPQPPMTSAPAIKMTSPLILFSIIAYFIFYIFLVISTFLFEFVTFFGATTFI